MWAFTACSRANSTPLYLKTPCYYIYTLNFCYWFYSWCLHNISPSILRIHSSFIDAVHMAVLVCLVHCSFITWRNTCVYLLTCVTRGHRNYNGDETCRTERNNVVLVVSYSAVVSRWSIHWHSGSSAGPDNFGRVIAQHSHRNYSYSPLSYSSTSSWYAVRYSIFALRSFYFTFQWHCFVCYP